MAYYHRSYADIVAEHLHVQIHENLATNQRILRKTANDGKEFCMGVDNFALANAQDPHRVMNEALQHLQQGVDNYNNQLAQAQMNQSNAAQQAMMNHQAQVQQSYLNQIAVYNPRVAEAYEELEEIEEEVVKEVYKAAFDLRRFLDKLIHLPISLIDRMATPCGV